MASSLLGKQHRFYQKYLFPSFAHWQNHSQRGLSECNYCWYKYHLSFQIRIFSRFLHLLSAIHFFWLLACQGGGFYSEWMIASFFLYLVIDVQQDITTTCSTNRFFHLAIFSVWQWALLDQYSILYVLVLVCIIFLLPHEFIF